LLTIADKEAALERAEKVTTAHFERIDTTVSLILTGSIVFVTKTAGAPVPGSVLGASGDDVQMACEILVLMSVSLSFVTFWIKRGWDGPALETILTSKIYTQEKLLRNRKSAHERNRSRVRIRHVPLVAAFTCLVLAVALAVLGTITAPQ
jgi:hypothetical protein